MLNVLIPSRVTDLWTRDKHKCADARSLILMSYRPIALVWIGVNDLWVRHATEQCNCWTMQSVRHFNHKGACQFCNPYHHQHSQEGTPGPSVGQYFPGFTVQDLEAPDYLIGPQGTIEWGKDGVWEPSVAATYSSRGWVGRVGRVWWGQCVLAWKNLPLPSCYTMSRCNAVPWYVLYAGLDSVHGPLSGWGSYQVGRLLEWGSYFCWLLVLFNIITTQANQGQPGTVWIHHQLSRWGKWYMLTNSFMCCA